MWGNKVLLVNMTKSELFGETFVCGNQLHATVSFMAASETVVLFFPFKKIMHTCSKSCNFHHKMIENMVAIIANKNMLLMEKVDIISKKSLREKISAYLTLQAERQQDTYIDIPLGRVELAEYLHANRSALTRELNAMSKEGLIEYDKNSFHILKKLY
jgi:CRP-like cAMP-binding protein